MITLHCIDVSGSMSPQQIDKAQKEMLLRYQPKDVVCLFDTQHVVVTDLDRPFNTYPNVLHGGGTCCKSVLAYAESLGAMAILYSDGYLLTGQLEQFEHVVIV